MAYENGETSESRSDVRVSQDVGNVRAHENSQEQVCTKDCKGPPDTS